MAATLVVSYDDVDEEKIERRFVVLRSGDAIPPGTVFVKSWRRDGCGPNMQGVFCLFERVGFDVPADLPAEAYPHWRVLQRDGFTLRDDRAWLAPSDDMPSDLSREHAIAVATLQEYGYGSVVYA